MTSMFKSPKTHMRFKESVKFLPEEEGVALIQRVFLLWREKSTRTDGIDDFLITEEEYKELLSNLKNIANAS